jgi:hypothetical protein
MACKKCKNNKCNCEAVTCINPLIYFIKSVFALLNSQSSSIPARSKASVAARAEAEPVLRSTLYEILSDRLDQGLFLASNPNLCCPDCKRGPYILANVEVILKYLESLGITDFECCYDYYGGIESLLKFREAVADANCCESDFADVINLWLESSSPTGTEYNLDEIINNGILEVNTFNGYSGLGILFNYLQLNHPELTETDYTDILAAILEKGIVISCDGCEIIISGIETYLKWYEAGSGGGAVPA